jgi:predicted Zn-dependent protease
MSAIRRRLLTGLPILVGLACGDIASPTRTDTYEWRLETPSVPGPGLDTLAFHWSQADLPVRVWVEDADDLPRHIAQAIEVWESAFLYGEFDATIVDDPAGADVVVQSGAPAPGLTAVRLHTSAPQCAGATDLDIDVPGATLTLPIRVFVDPSVSPEDPGLERCLALTSVHELGHALGIFAHSPNAEDIMFADPGVEDLSDRDRRTAEAAYHIPPSLTLVRP